MNKKDFVASVRQKYAPSVPQIDRERYTEIPGMEGPFALRSGKVVYYDPKEGKYYDRDSDMYMSDEDYHAHSNPRNESVNFYKFWCILEGIKNEWDPNDPDEGPKDFADPYPTARGEHQMSIRLSYENGMFHDEENNKSFRLDHPALNAIIGEPGDFYNLETTVYVQVGYKPGYDHGVGDASGDEEVGRPLLDLEGFYITNERTGKQVLIPDSLVLNKIVGMEGDPAYKVDYSFYNGKVRVTVN